MVTKKSKSAKESNPVKVGSWKERLAAKAKENNSTIEASDENKLEEEKPAKSKSKKEKPVKVKKEKPVKEKTAKKEVKDPEEVVKKKYPEFRNYLMQNDITQKELAHDSHMSVNTIYRMTHFGKGTPSIVLLTAAMLLCRKNPEFAKLLKNEEQKLRAMLKV